MAKKAKAKEATKKTIEQTLWDSANELRGNLDAAEYKSVVLGLVFLKYINDCFKVKHDELVAEGDGFEEDPDEYIGDNIFFVPADARWDKVVKASLTTEIGVVVDAAMEALEKENKQLLIQNQFSIEVHTVDSFVYTDTKALVFILGQIINNSAQYRSSSPLLTFRAIDTNHHVYLEIQDNGTGIRESDLGRVFEKGFTGSNGHQRKTSTGIGLYLCKQLCKELGIEITIRSAVNKYTCVSLAFQKSIESRAIP